MGKLIDFNKYYNQKKIIDECIHEIYRSMPELIPLWKKCFNETDDEFIKRMKEILFNK